MNIINEIYPDKAQYQEDDEIKLLVKYNPNSLSSKVKYQLKIDVYKLNILYQTEEMEFMNGEMEFIHENSNSVLTTLPISLGKYFNITGGFGVELSLMKNNILLEFHETSFDIANPLKKSIRYGFLSDFDTKEKEDNNDVEFLLKNHINYVQFYDWSYRHDNFVAFTDCYEDMMGKFIDLNTVKHKISLCHKCGMITMAYGAVYAASKEYYEKHPDYAMYNSDFQPMTFIDIFYYMNISPDCPWHHHIIENYLQAIKVVGFDGIHMDTYGYPKTAYAKKYRSSEFMHIHLDELFPLLINNTYEKLHHFVQKPNTRQEEFVSKKQKVSQLTISAQEDITSQEDIPFQKDNISQENITSQVNSTSQVNINSQKDITLRKEIHSQKDVHLIFNNVGNWPVDSVCNTKQEAIYIEVWSPYVRYWHLREIIKTAKLQCKEKPVILAAYLPPFRLEASERAYYSALLLIATVTTYGGYHLLLGENKGILTQGYYVDYSLLNEKQEQGILQYNNFILRYLDLFFDDTLKDISMTHLGGDNHEYVCNSTDTCVDATPDKIWITIRENKSKKLISFINLCGNEEDAWNVGKNKPIEKNGFLFEVQVDLPIEGISIASPDQTSCALSPLPYKTVRGERGKKIQFTVPKVFLWTIVYIKFEDS